MKTIVLFLFGIINCIPILKGVDWNDSFETYSDGTFPSSWISNGYTSHTEYSHVTSIKSSNGSKSLQLFGKLDGCLAALAYKALDVTSPFIIEVDINNGNETLSGCHPERAGIGLRMGNSWMNPSRTLVHFDYDGYIYLSKTIKSDAYITNTWYTLKIRYEMISSSQIKLSFWINNVFKGDLIQATISDENLLNNIELNVQEGTAWFDNVKVYSEDLTEPCPGIPTVTDYDGNIYNTVQIGNQCWMKENLKTTKYNDGEDIPLVTDNTEWINLENSAYCWYNNDETTYKNTYGALYNWYTVNTGKLCPLGWHVATDEEWTILSDLFGGFNIAGGKLKEAGTAHWLSPNTGATNESGFAALPGGRRSYISGNYYSNTRMGFFWTSTKESLTSAYGRMMAYDYEYILRGIYESFRPGHSVRCIKDKDNVQDSIARIKFSYIINEEETVVEIKEIKLNEEIGNLSFSNNTDILSMPRMREQYYNSRTFKLSDYLYNDGKLVSEGKYESIFEILYFNYCNVIVKIEILNDDLVLSDNVKYNEYEIWAADFNYGEDNYRFANWSLSTSEILEYTQASVKMLNLKYPIVDVVDIIEAFYYKGGHCYGFSASSILYKYNPEWIPVNKNNTYDLFKADFDVMNNIIYCHQRQFYIAPILNWNALFKSKAAISKTQLQKIKDNILQNKLLIASYNSHATVLHTMIKNENYYELYEYNNSYTDWSEDKNGPASRGKFIITSEGVLLNSDDNIIYFNYPNFSFDNTLSLLKSTKEEDYDEQELVIDSLLAYDIKKYKEQGINLLYIDFNNFNDSNIPNTHCNANILDSINFGFGILYLLNENFVDVDIQCPTKNTVSIGVINTALCDNDEITYMKYDNLELDENCKLELNNIFDTISASCQFKLQDDILYETNPNIEVRNLYTTKDLPPVLLYSIDSIIFSDSILSYSINMSEHVYDDKGFDNLTLNFEFDSSNISVEYNEGFIEINPLNSSFKYTVLFIDIYDISENILNVPILIKNISTIYNNVNNYSSNNIINTCYYNPLKKQLFFKLEKNINNSFIEIYDIVGKLILKYNYENLIMNNMYSINISDLKVGVYVFRLSSISNISSSIFIVN